MAVQSSFSCVRRTLSSSWRTMTNRWQPFRPRGRKAGWKHPKPKFRIPSIVTDHWNRKGPRPCEHIRTRVLREIPISQQVGANKQCTIQTVITPRTVQPTKFERDSVLVKIPRISSCFQKLQLNAALWNARSMNGKIAAMATTLVEEHLDILIITETWIKSQSDPILAEFHSSVSGYNVHQQPRAKRKGGGVAVITRSNLRVVEKQSCAFQSFESLITTLRSSSQLLNIITIYRPPKSAKNAATINHFLSEFSTLLESAVTLPGHLVIAGDFNFHFDDITSPDTIKLFNLLQSMGLQQHVHGSTHIKGHTLDLLITRSADQFLHSIRIDDSLISDHSVVHFGMKIQRPPNSKVTTSRRNYRTMNIDDLQVKLAAKFSDYPCATHPEMLSEFFNATATDVLDDVVPVTT